MRVKQAIVTACILLLTCAGAAFAVEVGDAAPDFEIKTEAGKLFRMEEVKGKSPVFLVFWATWCPVCKEEIPKLKEIYSTFKPRGMDFLAINVGINDSQKKVVRYVKKYGIDYPVAFDSGSKITKLYGVMGTPTIMIVDRSGFVKFKGAVVPDDLGDHFDNLLE